MAGSAEEILSNAAETLSVARLGLADFLGPDPSRRLAGFKNAVVFGRAVTNVLEHLRGKVPAFDDWYKPRSAALGQDEGFAKLYKLRSQILKEGSGAPSVSSAIEHLNPGEFALLMKSPPPGARGFFIGDATGGSGWEVELGSGEVERYYVAVPPSVGFSFSHKLGNEDAGALLTRYLDAMRELIAEARKRFAGQR